MDSFLHKYLKDILLFYLQDVQDDLIEVDILSGNVTLSNLTLKNLKIPLSEHVCVSILKGTIERVNLQIDFNWKNYGSCLIFLDNLEINLQVSYDNGVGSSSEETDQSKRKKLVASEQLMRLGFGSNGADNWFGSTVKKYVLSLLERFVLKSRVVLRGIGINFLIPITSEDFFCLRIHLDSIIVDDSPSSIASQTCDSSHFSSNSYHSFSKVLQIRNLSSSSSAVFRIEMIGQFSDNSDPHQFPMSLLINPFSLSVQVYGECSLGYPINFRHIVFEVAANEIQCNVQPHQLLQFYQALEYQKFSLVKRDLMQIKEMILNTKAVDVRRPRKLWKFAFYGICYLRRKAKVLFALKLQQIKHDSGLREYSAIYLQTIRYLLHLHYQKVIDFPLQHSPIPALPEFINLRTRIGELQNILSVKSIIEARCRIDRALIFHGLEPEILKEIIENEDQMIAHGFGSFTFVWPLFGKWNSERKIDNLNDCEVSLSFNFQGVTINCAHAASSSFSMKVSNSVRPKRHKSNVTGRSGSLGSEAHRSLLSLSHFRIKFKMLDRHYYCASVEIKSLSLLFNEVLLVSISYGDNNPTKALEASLQWFSTASLQSHYNNGLNVGQYHQLKTFHCTNLRKETVFAFFLPSQDHLVGEVNIGRIESTLQIQPVLILTTAISNAIRTVFHHEPGRKEKNDLANISLSRHCMSFKQSTKYSIELSLFGLSIHLPPIHDKSLTISVERCHLLTGDYMKSGPCSPDQHSLLSGQKNLEVLRPYLNPLHIECTIIVRSIAMVFSGKNGLTLTVIAPFNVYGKLYFMTLPTNLDFCEFCAGVIVGSVQAEVQAQVIEYLLEVVSCFNKSSKGLSTPNRSFKAPRISSLAKVSRLLLSIITTDIDLRFLSSIREEPRATAEDAVSTMFFNFVDKMKRFQNDPINQYIVFNQTKNQFKNIGLQADCAHKVLRESLQTLSSSTSAEQMEVFVEELRVCRLVQSNFDKLVFGVSCFGIEIVMQSMSYDVSLVLEIRRFNIFNNRATSLLEIGSDGEERFEDGATENQNVRSDRNEDDKFANTSSSRSTHVSLISKSEQYEFGNGGFSALALYQVTDLDETRNSGWFVDFGVLSIEFDTVSIIDILQQVSSVKNKILSQFTGITAHGLEGVVSDTNKVNFPQSRRRLFDSGSFIEDTIFPAVQVSQNHDVSCKIDNVRLLFTSHQENFCLIKAEAFQGMFSHSRQNDFRGSLGSVRLSDLTTYGRNYRDVVWNDDSQDFAVSFILMNQVREDCTILSALVRLRSLRLCFLYRFVLQMIDFIGTQIILPVRQFLEDDATTAAIENSSNQMKVEVILTSIDLSVFIPRNSFSPDLIGLTVESAIGKIAPVRGLWSAPIVNELPSSESLTDSVLVFDCDQNVWSRMKAKTQFVFNEYLDKLYKTIEQNDEDLFVKCDSDYDILKALLSDNRLVENLFGNTFRVAVFLRDIDLYSSLGMNGSNFPKYDERKNYLEDLVPPELNSISLGSSVRRFSDRSMEQWWFQVTRKPFNLDVMVDMSEIEMKLLFCDALNCRPLDIALSQAELYLFLGFWFDNFHETTNEREEAFELLAQSESRERGADSVAVKAYGDEQYFSYFLDREMTFEILLVLSRMQLSIGIDEGIFEKTIPSSQYLQYYRSFERSDLNNSHPLFVLSKPAVENVGRGRCSSWFVIPIGQIQTEGLIVQVSADYDVSRIGVTSGALKVMDGRIPKLFVSTDLSFPLLDVRSSFNEKRNDLNYGLINFSDFFEVTENRDIIDFCSVPFNVGIIMSSSLNWMNINLYLNHVDLLLPQLDLCLLLAEYFSCYFRFEEFGSPSLTAYYKLDSSCLPYGGTDFRLVLRKPHVSLLDMNLQSYLFAEADNGASYRYQYDTNGSVKTSYDIQSLSLVLVKEFDSSLNYRGARGSSGFGSAKTLVEFMNIFVHQLYCGLENRQDFKIEISCGDESLGKDNRSFGMKSNFPGLEIIIPETNYLNSLAVLSKNFPNDCSDVVISFEDVLMVCKMLEHFVGTDSSSDERQEEEEATSYLERFSGVTCFMRVHAVKVLLIDNTLGMHLPFFQTFLQDFAFATDNQETQLLKTHASRRKTLKLGTHNRNSISVVNKGFFTIAASVPDNEETSERPLTLETRLYTEIILWVESFNNLKKCWEPFIEPCGAHALFEKTISHGLGFTARLDTPFHTNFSGAIIHTLFDALRNYEVLFANLPNSSNAPRRSKLFNGEDGIVLPFKDSLAKDVENPVEFYSVKNSRERAFSLTNTNTCNVLTTSRIEHFRSVTLHPSVRVGFSLLNLSGQALRYLQQWEGGRQTVQYLGDGERGLLNFVPSQTLIRNHKIVEEAFDVQQGRSEFARSRMRKKLVGNRLALQMCGYRWIKSIQADELGLQYKHLSPILGRPDPTSIYSDDLRVKNVLKLMIEIVPFNQGRIMILRSVFSIRNECGHTVRILTKTDNSVSETSGSTTQFDGIANSVFELKSKESLYLPVSLLAKSILATNGSSLGLLYLQPLDSSSVREELISRLNIAPGTINYSTDPINLFHLAYRERKVNSDFESAASAKIASDYLLVSCHINPEERSRKIQRNNNIRKSLEVDQIWAAEREHAAIFRLPPFCYSIEILHNTNIHGRTVSERGGKKEHFRTLRIDEPRNFTIVIHPPITIENLLPCSAYFEILHGTEKRELWSANITSGKSQSIHTVSLEESLLLSVNLPYCRASEGILIHQPKHQIADRSLFAHALQRTIEGILDETESETILAINLYDSVGQGLRLNVENKEGAGGQRHLVVYCPYWVVNTSQFTFQIREEGDESLTAGSLKQDRHSKVLSPVSVKNSLPDFAVDGMSRRRNVRGLYVERHEKLCWPVFPGCFGPLHTQYIKEVPLDSQVSNLFNDLTFEQISSLAYLFNFHEDSSLLSSKGFVKIQLDNSDWSKSLSLLSVGVNQSLSVDHQEKGVLEIGWKVKSAPGRLSQYTKIVRFTPRFIVVNRMKSVLKVCQVGNFQEASFETEVSPQHARPYSLPFLFEDRKVYLKVDGPWEKSVSFSIDQIGVFQVQLKRKIDLASVPHVKTRGEAEYFVELPPNRLIGLGFETDWGEENIVVKSIQSGSYAAKETDIRVGDVLLSVDGELFSGEKFEEAMSSIKSKLQRSVCILKLRTVEEKLRLMREYAFLQIQKKEQDKKRSLKLQTNIIENDGSDGSDGSEGLAVRVELRQVESSIVILASELDLEKMEEYRIENQSVSYRLYYRQKGIPGSAWNCINPGQSSPYIFEDPSKPHKLLLHVGENVLCPSDYRNSFKFEDNGEIGDKGKGDESLGTYLGYLSGMKADSAITLNLDEIGFSEELPLQRSESKLLATMRSEGPTKVLVISPSEWKLSLLRELDYSTEFIFEQLVSLKEFANQVERIRKALFEALSGKRGDSNIPTAIAMIYGQHLSMLQSAQEDCYKRNTQPGIYENLVRENVPGPVELKSHVPFQRLFDAGIEKHHQLLVEVLEARDITPFVAGKVEDIYCQIYIRNREKRGIIDRNFLLSQYTYVCDQSFEPKWLHQRFVFDIVHDAFEEIRNHSIRVLVKAKSIAGVDAVISKVDIPLSCLKSEEEVEGWFSLRQHTNNTVIGLRTAGSIRLRLQWIYTEYGFSGYVIEQCNRRARELLVFHNVWQFISSRLKEQLKDSKENRALAAVPQIELLTKEARSYYYRILAMAKEREAAKLKIPSATDNVSSANAQMQLPSPRGNASTNGKSPQKIAALKGEDEEKDGDSVMTGNKFVTFSAKAASESCDFLDDDTLASPVRLRHAHERILRVWMDNLSLFSFLHRSLSAEMERGERFLKDVKSFIQIFNVEAARNFSHVYTSSCILEIKPVKVENIPIKNAYVHGKVSYGEKLFRTRSIPSSHYMTWSAEDEELDLLTAGPPRRFERRPSITIGEEAQVSEDEEPILPDDGLSGTFEIDLLNIRGSIKVRLIAETFPSSQEFARIEIPVFGVIDSTCILPENEWFSHTFPLMIHDSQSARFPALQSHTDQYTNRMPDKNQPRITLSMRMLDKKDVHSVEGRKSYCRLQIPSFSFSCIDSDHARDIMLVTLINLELRSASARDSTNMSVILWNLQVDNQLLDAMSSVILYPTPVKSPQPVIRMHVKKKNLLSQSNLDCYETIQFVIQELDLKLEQQVVLASWEMIKSWTKEIAQDRVDTKFSSLSEEAAPAGSAIVNLSNGNSMTDMANMADNDDLSAREFLLWKRHHDESQAFDLASLQQKQQYDIKRLIDDEDVEKIYIDDFKIFPIKINVSFLINPTYIIRKYRKEQREDVANDNASAGLYSALSVLLWQVGTVVLDLTSSISNAPIYFNGFGVPHLFKTKSDVTRTLQEHYFHSALGQLYKIVFSSDVVGNPIALLNSLSVGVHDFFYEPAHALITTPTEISKIGKGFVKGAASLLSNATVGFIGTSTTITRSIGRGVLKLSMDESFIKAREKLQQNPKNVSETVSRPLRDIGNGFYHGITGLFTVPYRSVKKKGAPGIVPGLAKGIIGLGADPVVGILDAVTHCGDAAREIAKKINKRPEKVVDRMRLGSLFGVDGRILPYDYNAAFGTQILYAMARPLGEDHNLLATTLMQGNNFMNEVLGGSDEIISLEQAHRHSFVNLTHRASFQQQQQLQQQQQQTRNSSSLARMSLQQSKSLETYANPLTVGGGATDANEEVDDNSSDDSQIQNANSRHRASAVKSLLNSHHSEEDENEAVVHTAIIRKRLDGVEYDVVAVLSSKRLIILEQHQKGHSTFLKKKWEASLKQLAPPNIVSSEGDAALTLELSLLDDRQNSLGRRKSVMNMFVSHSHQTTSGTQFDRQEHNQHQSKSKNHFKLKGNYLGDHIIFNLYNCVNTLLGNFDELQRIDMGLFNRCTEDESGIRHIGPWQYSRSLSKSRTFRRNGQLKLIYRDEEDAQLLIEESKRTINKLKYELWQCIDDRNDAANIHGDDKPSIFENRPKWLIIEEKQAISDQNMLKSTHEECKRIQNEFTALSTQSQEKLSQLLIDLHSRKLSKEEFLEKVEEARGVEHEDDQSQTSNTTNNERKPKSAILRSAMRSILGSLSRRSSQRFTKSDMKLPEMTSDSIDGTDTGEIGDAKEKEQFPEEEEDKSTSLNRESIGKQLLSEPDLENSIHNFIPFSNRRKAASHKHRDRVDSQATQKISPANSISSFKATDEHRVSFAQSPTPDDESVTSTRNKKSSWLWKLFNDGAEVTRPPSSAIDEASSTVDLDCPTNSKPDNDQTTARVIHSMESKINNPTVRLEGEEDHLQNIKTPGQENEEIEGDIFEIFPNYDRFEASFDENGDLLETKFAESTESRVQRLGSRDIARGFNNDYSTFSFGETEQAVAESAQVKKLVREPLSPDLRVRDSSIVLRSAINPRRDSPFARGYSSLLETETTSHSLNDSRFDTLQLDHMNDRLNKIENLLMAVLSSNSASTTRTEDFVRPLVHEISEDLSVVRWELNNSDRTALLTRDGDMYGAEYSSPFSKGFEPQEKEEATLLEPVVVEISPSFEELQQLSNPPVEFLANDSESNCSSDFHAADETEETEGELKDTSPSRKLQVESVIIPAADEGIIRLEKVSIRSSPQGSFRQVEGHSATQMDSMD